MPANKGYKFKDVIFFGSLPADGGADIIFERINKRTTYIYTWDKDFSYKHEKKGRRETLLEKIPRKGSFNSLSDLGQKDAGFKALGGGRPDFMSIKEEKKERPVF